MKPLTLRLILISTIMMLCNVLLFAAEKLDAEKQQAEKERLLLDVKSVLRAEQKGTLSNRERSLAPLLDSENAPNEAYWQAGYLKRGERWISVKDRPLTVDQEAQRKEYAKLRANYDDSEQSHWELARWCHEHQLDSQCRAHLMAILLDHPDHVGLRQMLGYQKIGHRWMNREEYDYALQEAERLAQDLQQWGPKVASIRDDLQSPLTLKRSGAKERLKDILDVAAVPALEMILLPHSDEAAALCVEQLCQIKNRRASIALCKAAMFLPDSSATTKQAAIEELKTRPLEDFVPVLLDQMQTPLTAKFKVAHEEQNHFSNGPFNLPVAYEHWSTIDWLEVNVSSETAREKRQHSLHIKLREIIIHLNMRMRNGAVATPLWNEMLKSTPTGPIYFGENKLIDKQYYFAQPKDTLKGVQADIRALQDRENVRRGSAETYRNLNHQLDQQNQEIYDRNEKVTELLGAITHQSLYASPEHWWSWWKQKIEVESDQKIARHVHDVNEVAINTLYLPSSCFVAGTPVWTERGAIPIEQLRVGDMALSKNVETGEVAYRPIIRTTTREPKPLVIINLGVEQITSTGGHPFWVAGEGWVRARQLTAGQLLHTPTGTMTIESVIETAEDKTYNLVVDGFHTYFVGMEF